MTESLPFTCDRHAAEGILIGASADVSYGCEENTDWRRVTRMPLEWVIWERSQKKINGLASGKSQGQMPLY